MRLLSVNQDAKTVKGLKKGYLTGILYLSPCSLLCPACSEGCRKACLFTAGHGQMNSVRAARNKRTDLWLNEPDKFRNKLFCELSELVRMAEKKQLTPCVRLNGTSDIDVQKVFPDVLKHFSNVQFYDYTKVWDREVTFPNYYLCYSRSETTPMRDIQTYVEDGKNVAIVFDKVPLYFFGMQVIDGDESDLRFLDKRGVIVGLKAKGKARHDTTGFVVRHPKIG